MNHTNNVQQQPTHKKEIKNDKQPKEPLTTHVYDDDGDQEEEELNIPNDDDLVDEEDGEAVFAQASTAQKYCSYVGGSVLGGPVSSRYSESEDFIEQVNGNDDDDDDDGDEEEDNNNYDMSDVNNNNNNNTNNNDSDENGFNQTSTNSSLQENAESMKTKSIYLTSHDGAKVLSTYLIKKELIDTGIKNKRNSTLACRRQYLCIQCPYKEKSFTNFSAHLTGHIERNGVSKCRYCSFYETSRTKLANHEKLHPEHDAVST